MSPHRPLDACGAPLTPIPSPSRGEGGSYGSIGVLAETSPKATLLPLREKVGFRLKSERSDEGCSEPVVAAVTRQKLPFSPGGRRCPEGADEGGAALAKS